MYHCVVVDTEQSMRYQLRTPASCSPVTTSTPKGLCFDTESVQHSEYLYLICECAFERASIYFDAYVLFSKKIYCCVFFILLIVFTTVIMMVLVR